MLQILGFYLKQKKLGIMLQCRKGISQGCLEITEGFKRKSTAKEET
jgi:hypothetical protein